MLNSDHTLDLHEPFRILIANDQEWTARSLESILANDGYEIIRAYTGRQALDRAAEAIPDFVILDVQLPDISGPDVCRRLRQDSRIGWCTPIVLTTAGSNGRARQAEAFEAGAWDFWPQPFDGPLLLLKVGTFLRARAEVQAARREALIDRATGLYSRTGLTQRLGELTAHARRRQERVSCLVLSVGSPDLAEAVDAAQDVGGTVGRAIRSAVRASDIVGRISPVEFVVVASGLQPETAGHLVERFTRAIAAARPMGAPAIPLRAGVASLEDGPAESLDDMLLRATALAAPLVPVAEEASARPAAPAPAPIPVPPR